MQFFLKIHKWIIKHIGQKPENAILIKRKYANHPKARPLLTTQKQSEEHKYNQQLPKNSNQQSIVFHDRRNTQSDRTENRPFFNKTKITQRIDNSTEVNLLLRSLGKLSSSPSKNITRINEIINGITLTSQI